MTRSTDRLERLADLDPAGPPSGAGLADAERARADALLERILATDPATAAAPTVAPRPRRRTPRLLLAGGVVAAVAAAVVAVPLVVGGDEAFAGWSPVPVELTGAERDAAVTACSVLQTDEGELAAAPGATPRPLVAEARGGWSYVQYRVGARDGGTLEASCLMPDEVVADPVPGAGGFFGGLGPATDAIAAPRRGDAVREETAGVGEVDDGVFGYASGRVGDDVERLVVDLADGREVEASVEDGRWAAWWPTGEDGFRDTSVTDAWTYTATLRDGTVLGAVDG